MKISQSLIKDLLLYTEGKACGKQVEAKFLFGMFDKFVSTDAMSLGTWFEYECTGVIPKNGIKPEPKRTQKGELYSQYKKLEPHIENFKKTMMAYGLQIIDVDVKVKYDDLEGTLDILALAQKDIFAWHEGNKIIALRAGQKCIIDIKTSGLLDNKWDDYGWDLSRLEQKEKLVLQPVHYMYIMEKKNGVRLPFFFFLFNTKNDTDFRIINFAIDDDDIRLHETTIKTVKKHINYHNKLGWKTVPSTDRCAKCPLKLECDDFAAVPPIIYFPYSSSNA